VILLTDGDPSQVPPVNISSGVGAETPQGAATAVNSAVNGARRIRYRGYESIADGEANVDDSDQVDVFVIGFNLANEGVANQIAAAGGTNQAIITTSTEEVREAFSNIFSEILTRGATRSGLSIISTPDAATGSFVQPSFTPLIREENLTGLSEQVAWVGEIRNFFIDRFGNFREDGGNAILDSDDQGFRILFDNETDQTYVERFDVDANGVQSNLIGQPNGSGGFVGGLIEVNDLNPVWSGSEQLNRLDDNIAAIAQNRNYETAVSDSGASRYIFSWIEEPDDVVNFVWSDTGGSSSATINPSNRFVLDIPTPEGVGDSELNNFQNEAAENLVNYIRGAEIDGLRNRTIDSEKFLLGDIVHSTPVQIDEPTPLNFSTNPLRTDALRDTYAPYAQHYLTRRKMVYVGANDGMLHAFSGGFWDIDSLAGSITVNRQRSGSDTNHRLGDEVWAFVPNAVLPHLKFLADENYLADEHISFVDGSLDSYEVKIFDDASGNCVVSPEGTAASTCRYVNGWGTILVGGLRYGGAPYGIDLDNDGDIEEDEFTRSSFFIIDVTDPERPPVLIDEVSHPDLQLTTSKPALVRLQGSSSTDIEYRLVFGSGPDDLETATNTIGNGALLFVYDFDDPNNLESVEISGDANSAFIGDITSVDWNQDDIDDAIYFGSVAGTEETPTGQLFRGIFSGEDLIAEVLINVNQPIQYEPVIPTDQASREEKYVLFGAGRTYSLGDTSTTYEPFHYLYGIKEEFTDSINSNPVPFASAPLATLNQLLDTSDVNRGATSIDDDILGSQDRAEVLTDFENDVYPGWKFQLPVSTSRLSARGTTLQELVFFTDFQPQDPGLVDEDQCVPPGAGFLNIVDYRTGLFPPFERLEINSGVQGSDGGAIATLNLPVSSSLLGAGQVLVVAPPTPPSSEPDPDSSPDDLFFKLPLPGSNQEITDLGGRLKPTDDDSPPPPAVNFSSGRKSWREINL